MPLYESVLIARQDLAAPQAEALGETFQALVEANGGKVSKREYWGLRNLAYKIKKNRKGHYVFMNVEANAETLSEVERSLHYNEDVLRYLSIRVDALDVEASPMMRNKSQREDRSIKRESETEGDEA